MKIGALFPMKLLKKYNLLLLLAGWLFSLLPALAQQKTLAEELAQGPLENLQPQPSYTEESRVVTLLLTQYHYREMPLNDSLSAVIFNKFMESLDYEKLYFLESDVRFFERYRLRFDDYLKLGNLKPAYQLFNAFRGRFFERLEQVDAILDNGFDYSKEEYVDLDRSNDNWASNTAQLNNIWRKYLKHQVLNLKLAGKTEEESIAMVRKRYARNAKNVRQWNSEDVFQVYMNAFTESFDPHTSYFSPISKENFKINISQSLEGIGARLQTVNDYTKVAEVIAGGPAFKSNDLFANDKIVAVAQGLDGEMVDVVGWRIDDVVKLIRGPKGTIVKLKVLRASAMPDDLPDTVKLVRDKIKLEDQSATKQVVPFEYQGRQYTMGVITLPSFYMDFEGAERNEKDYKSTTRDVRRLIDELKAEGVDGITIDLRFNGGGSLSEAINLSGLFMDKGPMVQVRNTDGTVEVGRDNDAGVAWDGPMNVLINRFSASASEIFAGAIQDYERGVIVGEQTFGKGTVQQLYDLEMLYKKISSPVGQIKMTRSKFYRVTGSSTQHRGVTPDVEFPSPYSAEDYGESASDNALPWDRISAVEFASTGMISNDLLAKLNLDYKNRLPENQKFQELMETIERVKNEKKKTLVSLNEAQRKLEMDKRQKEENNTLKGGSLSASEVAPLNGNTLDLNDAYLEESLLLLADLIKYSKIANNKSPKQ